MKLRIRKRTKEKLLDGIAIVGNILLILTIVAFAKGKTQSLMMAVSKPQKGWSVKYVGGKGMPLMATKTFRAPNKSKSSAAGSIYYIPASANATAKIEVRNKGKTAGMFNVYVGMCMLKGPRNAVVPKSCDELKSWVTGSGKGFHPWKAIITIFNTKGRPIDKIVSMFKSWTQKRKSIKALDEALHKDYDAEDMVRVKGGPFGPVAPGAKAKVDLYLRIPRGKSTTIKSPKFRGGSIKTPQKGHRYVLVIAVQDYGLPSQVFTKKPFIQIPQPLWKIVINVVRYSVMGVGGAHLLGSLMT